MKPDCGEQLYDRRGVVAKRGINNPERVARDRADLRWVAKLLTRRPTAADLKRVVSQGNKNYRHASGMSIELERNDDDRATRAIITEVFMRLIEFVNIQCDKLEENNHKTGWRDCSVKWLLNRLRQETKELQKAIETNDSIEEVRREAADVANFAYFIADVYTKKL